MFYLIDCGHNYSDTWQKRSPVKADGTRFYEFEFNRDVGRRLADLLVAEAVPYAFIIDPDDRADMSLSRRVQIANSYARKYGSKNCLYLSLHSNALGHGEAWYSARGWSVWTSKGRTRSDAYADIFFKAAASIFPKYGMTVRADRSDGDDDYESNFYVLAKTSCPAVLFEQFFYTNKQDLSFLESASGVEVCADVILKGIKEIETL